MLCLYGISVNGQQASEESDIHSYSFAAITSEQGLPHYSTHHIMQDSFGFVWISTRDGLCRFDGNTCTVFRAGNNKGLQLEANLIWLTFEDSKQRLWVGTKGGGLSFYDLKNGHSNVFKSNRGDSLSLSNNIVTAIYQDSDENLWVGTDGGGLNRVFETSKPDSFYFKQADLGIGNESVLTVMDIIEVEKGKLWLATYGHGIMAYDTETGVVQKIDQYAEEVEIQGEFVMTLAKEDSVIWAGTKFHGLFKIDTHTGKVSQFAKQHDYPFSIPNNFVWDVYIDGNGGKWISLYGGGLVYINPKTKTPTLIDDNSDKDTFTDQFVLNVMSDNQGQFWVATDSQGAFRFNINPIYTPVPIQWPEHVNTANLIINNLFLDSADQFWISTNSGLFTADSDFKNIQKKNPGVETSIFYEVNEDKNGTIWVATNLNLAYYQPEKGSWGEVKFTEWLDIPGTERIFDIEFDSLGNVWMASDGGLIKYSSNNETEVFQQSGDDPQSIRSNKLSSIYYDGSRTIWVGTDDLGISLFDISSEQAVNHELDKFLAEEDQSNYITDISDDGTGNMLIGTADQGIYYIFKSEGKIDSVRHINNRNSLQSSQIYDIESCDHHFLVSYREGVAQIDKQTLQPINLKLPLSINATGSKELFTAGRKTFLFSRDKIYEVNHAAIQQVKKHPKIQLTGLEIYNEPVEPMISNHNDTPLELQHHQDFITLSYAVLNHDPSAFYSTEYILEGQDPYWLDGGESETINYTNLKPGTYTFKVRFPAADNSAVHLQVPIIIKSAFWQSSLFRFLVVLVILLLIYLGFRYRTFYLLKEERTRTRIARDLHDDLSGTLSSISFFSEAARRVHDDVEEAHQFLHKIEESATEAKEKINDIIWAIDPSKDDWSTFLKKCKRYATDALDSKEIDYSIQIDDSFKTKIKLELRQNLWLIYKEMINNLAIHSQADHATILFTEKDKKIVLEVTDDGVGFNKEEKSNRNGIRNIEERANTLGADIKLITSVGSGTKWIFTLRT